MNILLFTPSYSLMKKGYGSKRKLRAGLFPPLGLAYLASPLIKDGHDVRIIDASSYEYSDEQIWDMVQQFKPDIFGISSVPSSADESYALANFLKSKLPKKPIIYGGPHANCFPELVFENIKDLDMLVYAKGKSLSKKLLIFIKKTVVCPKIYPAPV